METIDNNEKPKRRIEDHQPDATLDWTRPGAPAVPAAATAPRVVPLRAVASMSVSADGISFFATPAAHLLEHGHYMLPSPGAQFRASVVQLSDMPARFRRDHDRGIPHPSHAHECKICIEASASIAARSEAAPIASNPEPALQQIKALALAAKDDAFDAGLPSEAAEEFMEKVSPAVVLDLIARIEGAERALVRGGFVDHGAQEWKPPVGPAPRFIEVAAFPATASGDDLRDQFEAWARGEGHANFMRMAGDPESYDEMILRAQWKSYRAAVSASTKPTADLPTNDEVFAEVQRQRGTLNHYVSTNAVNDTMAAARSLLATKPAAAPAYWNSQRKMIERAIIGLRDGWANRKDVAAALATLATAAPMASADAVIEATPHFVPPAPSQYVTDQRVIDYLDKVRGAALEQAALICDGVNSHDNPMTAGDCADAIRALKRTKAADAEGDK